MKSHFSISLWASLFIFFYTGVNIRAPWRELAFEHFVHAVVIKENMALVVWLKKMWEQWMVLPLTMPQCVLFICVCQCLRGLVEEEPSSCPWNWDIRCYDHTLFWDVPASQLLAASCPLTLETETGIDDWFSACGPLMTVTCIFDNACVTYKKQFLCFI